MQIKPVITNKYIHNACITSQHHTLALGMCIATGKLLCAHYTQKNAFEILLNQPEIRLYLPFPD